MITISLRDKGPAISIQDDRTYGDIVIYPRDYDEEKELLVELAAKLLKNED